MRLLSAYLSFVGGNAGMSRHLHVDLDQNYKSDLAKCTCM